MRKISLLFALLCLTIFGSYAQMSEGGLPPSFDEPVILEEPDLLVVAPLDVKMLTSRDTENEKNGTLIISAGALPVDFNMDNSGTWSELKNGTRIWRLQIKSQDAKAIALTYKDFFLPPGGKLFLYNESRTQVIGAFTEKINPANGYFSTELIQGDVVCLEYAEPALNKAYKTKELKPGIHINNVIYAFRNVEKIIAKYDPSKATGWGQSESCEVNINCSEGTNWQNQKRGVAEIFCTEDGSNYGFCTGTLVNNTSNDGTPYFLTADHCGGAAAANLFSYWQFYFKYEATGCTTPGTEPTYKTITGSTKKARGNMTGGSDFLLLQLTTTPNTTYSPYYNGWSRATTASTSGASIHHPAGDIKKISTYTSALTTASYSGAMSNAHWRVTWAATANGHGVTEGGSSGSPIFNSSGLQVGTLTGGSSFCTSPTSPDLYGKFDKHWDANGSTNDVKLQPWLDPTSTGSNTCPGYDPFAATILDANFTASATNITAGQSVTFTSTSVTPAGTTITGYNWTFTGGSPASSTTASPSVTYAAVGTYNVSLTVTNSAGNNNTETKTGYITVTQTASGFSMDFEACTDFSTTFTPWTVNDVDGSTTYGMQNNDFPNESTAMAYIAFNPSATTPALTGMTAHGGVRLGASFAATTPPNNDWLISNQIQLGTNPQLSFWVQSYTAQYGLERFKVGVSTTNNSPASFTFISTGTYEEAPVTWTQKTYSLAAYAGQNVYIAIQCVSNDAFIFMIDDIQITSGSSASLPTVTTAAASAITNTTATSGGNVTSDGGATVTARGVCYATTQNPTTSNSTVAGGTGTGSFVSNLTGLTASTTYYIRAYATNSQGTAYGNEVSFATTGGTASGCDTLVLTTSGLGWGSYANGNNSYGDKAKVNYFAGLTAGQTVQDVYVQFILAKGTTNTASCAVWNNTGTGGSPGSAPLATKTATLSSIATDITNQTLTLFHFTNPVTLAGPGYIGIILPTAAGDTVVLAADTSATPSYNVAWEQWSDNVWYAYNASGSWGINAALAVYPVVCTPTTDAPLNQIGETKAVRVYPNPAQNAVYCDPGNIDVKNVRITVFNMLGKQINVNGRTEADRLIKLDFSTHPDGFYLLQIDSPDGKIIRKISINR